MSKKNKFTLLRQACLAREAIKKGGLSAKIGRAFLKHNKEE